jgi:ribosomal-protein-alanine N-acetyltransferase
MKIVLETERLILREYVKDDAPAFFRLNSDPEVMRYVPDEPMQSVEQAREILITHPIADYAQHGFGRLACALKATRDHIGFCGLKYLKEIDDIDLGFRFLPEHWGKGLATEAARAVVRYGFTEMAIEVNRRYLNPCAPQVAAVHRTATKFSLDHIVGLAEPDNHASIRVLEKVGMQFTGVVRLFDLEMRRYVIENPVRESATDSRAAN